MLGEIIRKLAKIHENTETPSENGLCWAKRVEAKIDQSAIMNILTEAKEFDKIKLTKSTYKDNPRRSSTQTKMPAKQICEYYGSVSHHKLFFFHFLYRTPFVYYNIVFFY